MNNSSDRLLGSLIKYRDSILFLKNISLSERLRLMIAVQLLICLGTFPIYSPGCPLFKSLKTPSICLLQSSICSL